MIDQELGRRHTKPYYVDDEVNFVDLARMLARRRWWVLGVTLLCILGALTYVLVKDRQYTYTTSILIGELGLDKYVADARSARSTLETRVLPVVERQFVDAQELETIPFSTVVVAGEGDNFVNVRSQASQDLRQLLAGFHTAMADALTTDHNEKLSLLERESAVRLENLRSSLETQQRQLENLEALMVRLGETATEVEGNDSVAANAQSAIGGMEATLTSSSSALTLVLSQLQLTEQVAKRENRINELEGLIEEEELKRSWIKPTRVVNVATASIAPSGTSNALILAAGTILGLVLGVVVAFVAEFLKRVRNSPV